MSPKSVEAFCRSQKKLLEERCKLIGIAPAGVGDRIESLRAAFGLSDNSAIPAMPSHLHNGIIKIIKESWGNYFGAANFSCKQKPQLEKKYERALKHIAELKEVDKPCKIAGTYWALSYLKPHGRAALDEMEAQIGDILRFIKGMKVSIGSGGRSIKAAGSKPPVFRYLAPYAAEVDALLETSFPLIETRNEILAHLFYGVGIARARKGAEKYDCGVQIRKEICLYRKRKICSSNSRK